MDTFRQDIRYAFRRLFKSPGFSLVAVLSLALGIGANTAIFSVVQGVLLDPLPYAEPGRLVGLFHLSEGRRATMSGPNFADVRKLSQTLTDAAAISRTRVILTGEGEPVRLDGAEVSASFFDLLGVRPRLGRTFVAEENQTGRTNVVVLSYGLWKERFGAAEDIVGRKITP